MNTTNEQQPQVDPEKLTLLQIARPLRPTHYVAVCIVLGALLRLAYDYGVYHAEAENAVKLASLTGENSQCLMDLSNAKQQIATQTQTNAQLTGAANAENVENGALRQQLSDASARWDGQANCDFIHSQIKAAENEIDGLRGVDAFGGGARPDADSRIKALDTRIADYQAQLGSCGRSTAADR